MTEKERGRGHTGHPDIARGPEREEREATGLEKKTRGRPPGTPKHEELKPETLEKDLPGENPQGSKGQRDHRRPRRDRRTTQRTQGGTREEERERERERTQQVKITK